ncbi:MAG: endonuclease V [Phycisphaerales bacterium]|nr:endonuclease V [Phycisphaerales bacterium]
MCPLPVQVRWLAAADVAFTRAGRVAVAGVVLWDTCTHAVVEQRVARGPVEFPYVPGLLSFRELPTVLAAFRQLQGTPDVVLCDGHGRAHPQRCGLACHLGLWLQVPTVGVAKSRLCGAHAEPGPVRGARTPLWLGGEEVGTVLRTRVKVKPLYVSPGHLCDVAGAVDLTLAALGRYRLPEPARAAHALVTHSR